MQEFDRDIKGPATAEAGTTIEIEVQGDAPGVEVSLAGGPTTVIPVGPGRKAQIPVPNAPGSVLLVTGTGKRPVGQLAILIVQQFR